jgi:DNA helicase HerA-like ATPase
MIGRVVSVRGSKAAIEIVAYEKTDSTRATVGGFLAIDAGPVRLVGMITEVGAQRGFERSDVMMSSASVDLVGEIQCLESGSQFRRGLSVYPTIGDRASILSRDEIRAIYQCTRGSSIAVGHLYHDTSIEAHVDVDALLNKHFAILGSTGVGKSSGVAVILNELLAVRRDLRIFMLDGHNEYGRCFGDLANVINPRTSKLPFWLFNFEEVVDVIYGGRPGIDEELEILSELIPIAKSQYLQYKSSADRLTIKRPDPRSTGFTVDTPVPYLLQDLIGLIDERMGKLENRSSRMNYHRLIGRIEMIRNDPRYDFMFENANVGGDTMAELLNQLFRIDMNGKPITVMQLAGLPVEVMDAVVSVLCRLAFDFGLWSDGAIPLLFVCEEAHRYASIDHSIGFGPTRRALSRIAKEGRKYGVFLGLVSQRPAELDPTIISQCATLFAMRMANDRDQALLRSAISDETANLLAFIPSLGTREVIGFGEGMPLPARLTFKTLPAHMLPRGEAAGSYSTDTNRRTGTEFVQEVIDRWRRAATDRKPKAEETTVAHAQPPVEASGLVSASSRLDQAKYQLLRR